MRGHVRRRGSKWAAVYDAGVDGQGRSRQRWQSGFETRGEAEAFLARTVTAVVDGAYVAPSKLTLGQYLEDEWLPAIAGTVPLTLTTYASVVTSRIVPKIGKLRLQGISGGTINTFYRELAEGDEEHDGLSPASLRLTHGVLSRAMRDAVRWGRLARNPAAAADPPASRAQAWTAKELARFLEHVQNDRLYALWRLAATTGARRGELLGATWLALDVEAGKLRIEQQLVPTRGGVTFGPPKSKRSRRSVSLDEATVEALRTHRDAQLVERAVAGDAYAEHDLVFCDELGRPIYPQRMTEAFRGLRAAAGITAGSLHILRHTHATLALTNGVPVHIVAARLGDKPETILRVYAHLLPQSDEMAANQVAALIAR